MRSLFTALTTLSATLICSICAAQVPSLEDASAKLQSATVTVRVVTPRKADDELAKSAPDVTVFSGVSLGDGLIVAPLFVSDDMTIKVTLAGGQQGVATPRLLDEPSGLALLYVEIDGLKKLELAGEVPKVGSWVVSAAGWGVEDPVVSFGIVSGVDRRMPGSTFPPLLQCNVATTESSSGAGLVNVKGELLGVIVATDAEKNRGWTYAVPVKHILRILRTYKTKKEESESDLKGQVIINKLRRPIVGMVIGGGLDEVIVRRVSKGGPADRAGIKVGDQILAVDGIKIRSVYQAVNPTLYKQPGDSVRFLVKQKDGDRDRKVILGGGVEIRIDDKYRLSQLVEPKISIDAIVLRNSIHRNLAEVFMDENQKFGNVDKLELLKKAVERYQATIKIQQERLATQQKELEEATKLIKALESQVDKNSRDKSK